MQQKNGIVGYIYGDVGTTDFNFAVNGHSIRKFDYIFAPHKEGPILAQVMDIRQVYFQPLALIVCQIRYPDLQ